MSRAKIIAKSEESASIARWRTVSLFGYPAINCSKARPSTPFRSPNSCSDGALTPCFGRLDRARRVQQVIVYETAPKNLGAVRSNLVEDLDYCGAGVGVSAFPLPSCFFSPCGPAAAGICPAPDGGAGTASALYFPRPSP